MVILGFGRTEIEEAKRIINECLTGIKGKSLEEAKQILDEIRDTYLAKDQEFSKLSRSEAPERYSHFYYSMYSPYEGKIIVMFVFQHVNRRHPFSPDGWAALDTRWMGIIDPVDESETVYMAVAN